jgi:hypothetical protein
MKDSTMKDIEALEKVPQAEKDARHTGRLYPSELDEAIVNENPLTYSRDKLTAILCVRLNATPSEVSDHLLSWVEKEFKLI